jgi:hypothetical protein
MKNIELIRMLKSIRTAINGYLDDKDESVEKGGENLRFHGITNEYMPTWYANKGMNQYPKRFRLIIGDKINVEVVNNGSRWEGGPWRMIVVKQSEVGGRGMGIVIRRRGYGSLDTARIEW